MVKVGIPPGAQLSIAHAGIRALHKRIKWKEVDYRVGYMEAAIEQGLAWQIRVNRRHRGLSQKNLADALGTQQSAVSRMEDPEYGRHSIETLVKIAEIFDCALSVKFIPYSQLALDSIDLSPAALTVASYCEECTENTGLTLTLGRKNDRVENNR